MSSIKLTKTGRQRHWMDKAREWKQMKSLKGQKPLFEDVPIDHLEKK